MVECTTSVLTIFRITVNGSKPIFLRVDLFQQEVLSMDKAVGCDKATIKLWLIHAGEVVAAYRKKEKSGRKKVGISTDKMDRK